MPSGRAQFELTTPAGVLTRLFADGAVSMRVCVGHLDVEPDGLLIEMRQGGAPVPWESRAARSDALSVIRSRKEINDEQREQLLQWVSKTPFYSYDQEPF